MSAVYEDAHVALWHGDCLQLLPDLEADSVQAVVTDPPYGLGFMGKEWDSSWDASLHTTSFRGRHQQPTLASYRDGRNRTCRGCGRREHGKGRCACRTPEWNRATNGDLRAYETWCRAWASELFRVLRPGGHLVAFGSPRTWHRLAVAIEDAGFQLRDSIAWMYGQGFPKSLDIPRALRTHHADSADSADNAGQEAARWKGWGTGLKPAFEPILVARKPVWGTVADTVRAYGTGPINIDACRVHADDAHPRDYTVRRRNPGATVNATGRWQSTDETSQYAGRTTAGRWPPNVVLTHAPDCGEETCVPGCPVAILDTESGTRISGANPIRRHAPVFRHVYGDFTGQPDCRPARGATRGGASRFFPAFHWHPKAGRRERPAVNGVQHPTVKPLDLTRWLIRLVTPEHGVLLDPFAGSGTTLEAARAENRRCIGIEQNADYLPLIRNRLRRTNATSPPTAHARKE
ncbi:DNA-methyltransferase [Fodinicola acaciae]|uniref:DNA-methyltransferase n=1 Tax=Fodinicola acaciae TaxID=2681555 RepID=UPI001FE8E414|nr:site-specific DNA-methyltransferase [Fodinicola acaciae]